MAQPVTESTLFPKDVFIPGRFSAEERKYLAKHLGQKPSVLREDPPPVGANPTGLAVALQRFWGEEDKYDEIRKSIANSLEGDRRRMEQKRLAGGVVNYRAIGVGLGVGQMSMADHFPVEMSPRALASNVNYLADLMEPEEAEKIVSDPEAVRLAEQIECPYCEVVKSGPRAFQALDAHARRMHPERLEAWNEYKARRKEKNDAA